MHEVITLERLPVFWAPDPPRDVDAWTVRVEGLVSSPAQLPVGAIRAMPAAELTVDFRCEEGWEVPELRWTGVPLLDLLRESAPLPDAKYVGVAAGGFVTWLDLSQVESSRALLAYDLQGQPIPWEHGGPLRLVLADGLCYQSVKWVDRLVLASEPGVETAEHIAMDRLQS